MKKLIIILIAIAISVVAYYHFDTSVKHTANKPNVIKNDIEQKRHHFSPAAEKSKSTVPSVSEITQKTPIEAQQPATPPTSAIDTTNLNTAEPIEYKSTDNIFHFKQQSESQKVIESLQFNPYWGIEADFANIKNAHRGQESVLNQASEVRFRDSIESKAMMLNIVGNIPLSNNSSLFAKFGLNSWEIDNSQLAALDSNKAAMQGQNGINSDLNYGTDVFYGFGFKMDYDDFMLKSEMNVYEFDGETYEVYSIGGGFTF